MDGDRECCEPRRCRVCGYEWMSRSANPRRCPSCHSSLWNSDASFRFACLRCGHEWMSKLEHPSRCPSCQSKLWDEAPLRLQCKRCGHRWITKVDTSRDVRMCPACKSRKWDEVADIRICEFCGSVFVSRNRESKMCAVCAKTEVGSVLSCSFCGMVWVSADEEWDVCPRCGTSRDVSVTTLWSSGGTFLRYVEDSGCSVVYLWENGLPVSAEYLQDMLDNQGISMAAFAACLRGSVSAPRWESEARHLSLCREDYAERIPYFMSRLNLDRFDATILAIHFTGMSPEAIGLRLGVDYRKVRDSFDKIMVAFSENGICVNDAIFTSNPERCYDQP